LKRWPTVGLLRIRLFQPSTACSQLLAEIPLPAAIVTLVWVLLDAQQIRAISGSCQCHFGIDLVSVVKRAGRQPN
jgi:hypothetical protein